MAGGLHTLEIGFRMEGAAAGTAPRRSLPRMTVGAGTVPTPYQAAQAADAGAQFLVSPGMDEAVPSAAGARDLARIFPGW